MFFNEKGGAMPLVLMVILVISLLSTALWSYSMTDLKHVSIEEKRMQAHYLARSGAELVWKYIDEDPTRLESIKDKTSERQSFNDEPEKEYFIVKVYEDQGEMVIESTGEVDDITETLILEIDNKYWRK